jgi:flagellar biogenesis protein FliO
MMAHSLLRLLWALPLVLLVGLATVLLLRRVLQLPGRKQGGTSRLRSGETLQLSQHTRAHLIELDGASYLVVESTQRASLHALSRPTA